MVMARARFIKMSFHHTIKDRVEVFMKVVLSVEWLGIFTRGGRHWNMEKNYDGYWMGEVFIK